MSRFVRAGVGLCIAAAVGAQGDPLQRIEPGFEAAEHRILDLDRDGRADLVVVSVDGQVALWHGRAQEQPLALRDGGGGVLPHPERTLLTWADVLGRGVPQLVFADPTGSSAWVLGSGAPEVVRLSRRAAFGVRVDRPRDADFVQDLNRDGWPDLVLPVLAHPRRRADIYEIWVREAPEDEQQAPQLRLAASVPMRVNREVTTHAKGLSDELVCNLTIPRLSTEDVNGDERPDLLVSDEERRTFHIQRPDGTLPVEPDVSVDLQIFRDTTPAASVQPGRTLVPSDKQMFTSRDLDGDDIPDYVISHRRKVWVFHGTEEGPQFKSPSTVFKTAEDITALLVVKLDDDAYPDLLVVKVVVPTVATILAGLLGEWEVDIFAAGYTSRDGRAFEGDPGLKRHLALRLPAILDIMRDPQAIIDRFEGVGRSFRRDLRGDFNGDGIDDVGLLTEEQTELEFWWAEETAAANPTWEEGMLRELVFDAEDSVWNIDRLLGLLASQAQERVGTLTQGREPQVTLPLLGGDAWELVDLDTADFDGDGTDEILVIYRDRENKRAARFDVLRAR